MRFHRQSTFGGGKVDACRRQRQRVTHRNGIARALGGLNARYSRHGQYVTLRHRTSGDRLQRLGVHLHGATCSGRAVRDVLATDVHHSCLALFIEVRKLRLGHRQPPI